MRVSIISGLSAGFSQLLVADVDMLSCGGGFSGNWSQVDGRLTIWKPAKEFCIAILRRLSEYESVYALTLIMAPAVIYSSGHTSDFPENYSLFCMGIVIMG